MDTETATAKREAMATRLRQVRSILSANQAAVARSVGVAVNTWNRYEKGVRDIDPAALAEFCRVYGATPADQVGLAGWVLLGRRDGLNRQVLEDLLIEYPEIVRSGSHQHGPSNKRRSLGSQELAATL